MVEFDDAKDCAVDEKITLLKWGNATITKVDKVNDITTTIYAKQDLEDKDFKKTKKFHWISNVDKYNTKLVLKEYDHIVTVEKMKDDMKIEDVANKNSEFETMAIGEIELRTLKKGDIVQLERRGYFICDAPYDQTTGSIILIFIPDGKTKSMSNLTTKV